MTIIDKMARKTVGLFRKRRPDFIVMGGTRSGSTTLHFMLNQHPQIVMSKKQEPQYFNRDRRFRENLAGYTDHFALAPMRAMAGETTPMYMHKGYGYDRDGVLRTDVEEDAVRRIARILPDAKLILTLRDPMKRMISEYQKNRNQGKFEATLEQLLQDEEQGRPGFGYVFSNRYDIHLEHIFAHFPREHVLVTIFEEWTTGLPDSMTPFFEFLGVRSDVPLRPPDRREANSAEKYHSGKPLLQPGDAELGEERIANLRLRFQPTRDYVENLLGRTVGWSI